MWPASVSWDEIFQNSSIQKPLKIAVNISSFISSEYGEGGSFSMALENSAVGK